jgi:hypothetical protein
VKQECGSDTSKQKEAGYMKKLKDIGLEDHKTRERTAKEDWLGG